MMRLHLLEHDPIDLSCTNITIWAEKKGHKVTKTDVFNLEDLPSLDDFDWLMVMGGSQHVWEEKAKPWLPAEKKFIADVLAEGKIIFGICFGAQLVAEVLGAKVFPNNHEELGWHEVFLTPEGKESFLFKNVPEGFVTFHWHSDHFSLPPGCTRLAITEPTANRLLSLVTVPSSGYSFIPSTPGSRSGIFHRNTVMSGNRVRLSAVKRLCRHRPSRFRIPIGLWKLCLRIWIGNLGILRAIEKSVGGLKIVVTRKRISLITHLELDIWWNGSSVAIGMPVARHPRFLWNLGAPLIQCYGYMNSLRP